MQTSSHASRLITNVAATYFRMLVTVGLSIWLVRLVFDMLGEVDYGVVMALGASGAAISFLSDAMLMSAQRQLSVAVGAGDRENIARVFNTALAVFGVAALGLAVLGAVLAPMILGVLTIPPDRMAAAMIVYALVVAQFVMVAALCPFRALLSAHQALVVLSAIDLVHRLTEFVLVLGLMRLANIDKMVGYGVILFCLAVVAHGSPVLICLWRYRDIRPDFRLARRKNAPEIVQFAGWTLLPQAGFKLRNQGGLMAMSWLEGAVATSAFALAQRLMQFQNQIGFGLLQAVRPAIGNFWGANDRVRFARLSLAAGKYVVLACAFLGIPAILDMQALLTLWLGKEPPLHAAIFAQLCMATMMIQLAASGLQTAIEASGQPRLYALYVVLPQIVGLAGMVAAQKIWVGLPDWFLPAGLCVQVALFHLGVLPILAQKAVGLPVLGWVRAVIVPCVLVMSLAGGAAYSVRVFLPEISFRPFWVAVCYGIVAVPMVWLGAMAGWEREVFRRILGRVVKKNRQ